MDAQQNQIQLLDSSYMVLVNRFDSKFFHLENTVDLYRMDFEYMLLNWLEIHQLHMDRVYINDSIDHLTNLCNRLCIDMLHERLVSYFFLIEIDDRMDMVLLYLFCLLKK